MKRVIVYFGLFIFLFISCDKTENKYYNLDRSVWFRYKINDTLTYNSINNKDIFVIKNLYTTYEVFDKTNYNEYFCTQYTCLTDSVNYTLTGFCRFNGEIQINTKHHMDGVVYINYNTISLQIGDSIINDVYKINCTRVDSVNYKTKVFYYSHIYGVIRYDLYNDEIFELQLK
jgi:hypothetical protein